MKQLPLRLFLFLGILWLIPNANFAKNHPINPVCEGDVYLRSQNDVDNFNCERINGSLYINGKDILDLSPLQSLKSISANLHLGTSNFHQSVNIQVESLEGFKNLQSIGGNLEIHYLVKIRNLSGFDNLRELGGNLTLQYNNELRNLKGLEGLKKIAGNLKLESLWKMYNVRGLDSLREVGGNVKLRYLLGMVNLNGFNQLEKVGGFIGISSCYGIRSLAGFDRLESHEGSINLEQLFALGDMDGFPVLKTVGSFQTTNNDNMGSISGLPFLEEVKSDFVIAEFKSRLNIISGLKNLKRVGGNLSLWGKLKNLNVLENLEYVGGLNFTLPQLTELPDFLLNLDSLAFGLSISAPLTHLKQLKNIRYIGERIRLINCPNLENLQGLENFQSPNKIEDVQLEKCHSLSNLRGLPSFSSISNLTINKNQQLESLEGLQIDSVKGIFINENPMLNDIEGLSSINSISDRVSINDNESLDECCVLTKLFNLLSEFHEDPNNQIQVSGNLGACLNRDVVFQNCAFGEISCEGDIKIFSQSQVDAFDCQVINGSLTIDMRGLNDLSGLLNLEKINGDLILTGASDTQAQSFDLKGLDNLSHIGGDFKVYSRRLTSLVGLSKLVEIKGSLLIFWADGLKNLQGLESLRKVDGSIGISANTRLSSFSGLDNLKMIGVSLYLSSLPALAQIEGFDSIEEIGGNLSFSRLDRIKEISGFPGLKKIQGNLSIDHLDSLVKIQAFENLELVEGDIEFADLASVSLLEGFNQLREIKGSLALGEGSYKVTIDSIRAFPQLEKIGHTLFIRGLSAHYLEGFSKLKEVSKIDVWGLFSLKRLPDFPSLGLNQKFVGEIHIQDSPNLEELPSFANLKEIKGKINLRWLSGLKNINGLRNLSSVEGTLHLEGLQNLENLAALSSLVKADTLSLSYIRALRKLEDFVSLQEIEFLSILRLDNLASLEGLSGLERLDHANISFNESLSNYRGLPNLPRIGTLILTSNNASDLQGLPDYEEIEELLIGEGRFLGTNDVFQRLDGFTHLKRIGRLGIFKTSRPRGLYGLPENTIIENLHIEGNKNLINLKGLPPQTQMKNIHIINNDNFTGFQGLFSLEELKGELSIEGNPNLLNMAGLWNLKKMGGTFRLKDAFVLDLEGLSSLQEVGNIRIEDSWIRSLNGMDQLKIIHQNLFLEDNPNLGNISALESIQSLGEESRSIILVEIDKNGISNCCPILDLRDTFPDDGIDPNQRFHVFDNGRNCTNFGKVVATCNPLTITNSQSGTPIQSLQKGDVLPNTPFATTPINIKAELGNVPPEGSVQFSLQGPLAQEQIENQAPYFLFGDEGGQILKPGFYVLQIRTYAEKNAQGELLSTQTLGFTREADNPAILGFQVMDADNDQVIQALSSGDRIDLNQLNTTNLSIEALTAPDQIGSVQFQLQGPLSHDQVESVAHYALFGNDPFDFENFMGRELPEGTYSLVATPYSQPGAKGESGAPLRIDFEVFRGQGIQIFPNPSAGPISIQSEQAGEVQIFDSQGILKIQDKLQVEEIKSLELAPGLYFLKWKRQGKIEEKKIIIK